MMILAQPDIASYGHSLDSRLIQLLRGNKGTAVGITGQIDVNDVVIRGVAV